MIQHGRVTGIQGTTITVRSRPEGCAACGGSGSGACGTGGRGVTCRNLSGTELMIGDHVLVRVGISSIITEACLVLGIPALLFATAYLGVPIAAAARPWSGSESVRVLAGLIGSCIGIGSVRLLRSKVSPAVLPQIIRKLDGSGYPGRDPGPVPDESAPYPEPGSGRSHRTTV